MSVRCSILYIRKRVANAKKTHPRKWCGDNTEHKYICHSATILFAQLNLIPTFTYHTVWYKAMAKTNKEDWLKLGMQLLSKHGEESIKIEKLCAKLKLTKGSFYHHYKNIEDYVLELMRYWQVTKTENIIYAANTETAFEKKVEKLNSIVVQEDHLVEIRIRAWGIRNSKVNEFIKLVDQKRMNYLKSLYLEKKYNDQNAESLAKVEYAAFVGMQQLFYDSPIDEKIKICEIFQTLLNNNNP